MFETPLRFGFAKQSGYVRVSSTGWALLFAVSSKEEK